MVTKHKIDKNIWKENNERGSILSAVKTYDKAMVSKTL